MIIIYGYIVWVIHILKTPENGQEWKLFKFLILQKII